MLITVLIRGRYLGFGALLLLLVGLVALDRRVGYEQSIKSFFADDDPAMAAYQRAAARFGDDNFVFLAYRDDRLLTPAGIDRVAELAAAVAPDEVPGVLRVESLDAMPLLWKVDDALLGLDRLPSIARGLALRTLKSNAGNLSGAANPLSIAAAVRSGTPESLADLRTRLTKHPLFVGTLIDTEGTTTAVVVRLKKTDEHDVTQTIEALRSAADAFAERHGLERPAVVGPPVLLADGFRSIEIDGRRLAIVGMLLIGLVTLSATRSLWWAMVPIVVGWTVWLATEAILATLGLRLSLSGGPLVAQIIVLTMPAASHLAVHFRDDRRKLGEPIAAARSTLSAVMTPIVWTAITGAIGYGALVTSSVLPIRQFGEIMGLCTLISALLVIAVSPIAMKPPFPLELPGRLGSSERVGAGMDRLTHLVYRRPRFVVLGVFAIVIPVALGIMRLRYETNYINAFDANSRVVRDYRTVESRLGGIGVVSLVVPLERGVDADALAALDAVGDALTRGPGPAASRVLTLATILDPDRRLAELAPEARNRLIAAKLELIGATPQAELLAGFLSRDDAGRTSTRLLVRLVEQQPAGDKSALFDRAARSARERFGSDVELTGLSFLMTKTTEGVISTQWATFGWSAAGILVMLAIALRSPLLAAMAMLPTILAVGLVLGLMGWLGIRLDMATALVASVALGLSVDDTFHCLLQFRAARRTQGFAESLFSSYAVTGPGVLLSSGAVAVGFLALRLSEFVPFTNFGTMVGIATTGSTIGNLLLLPALLALGRPRVDPRDDSSARNESA
ncbi:MAG: MMPL family transporter [Isosphaeraceae bacterium]|nr:MMPL family transporter [Isosphaeraceae bacterium]